MSNNLTIEHYFREDWTHPLYGWFQDIDNSSLYSHVMSLLSQLSPCGAIRYCHSGSKAESLKKALASIVTH